MLWKFRKNRSRNLSFHWNMKIPLTLFPMDFVTCYTILAVNRHFKIGILLLWDFIYLLPLKSHAQNGRSDSTHMVHTNFNYPTCITEEANGVRQDLAEFQPPFRAEMADHPLNVTYTVCQKSIQYYTVCTKDPINSYSMLPNKSAVRITM